MKGRRKAPRSVVVSHAAAAIVVLAATGWLGWRWGAAAAVCACVSAIWWETRQAPSCHACVPAGLAAIAPSGAPDIPGGPDAPDARGGPDAPDDEVEALLSSTDEVGGSDLTDLRRELADVEGRRRRLLGEVAHEMRTPLTIIDGYVEGMIDGIIAVDAEELGHVTDEIRRLRRLADDLSALSRAQEHRLELRPLLLDLRGVVVSAAERLSPQIEDAHLRLCVETCPEVLPVHVDPDRFSQVVRNLVGNAVRATPGGGTITLRMGRSGRWSWFCVRDTGEGIAPADLERIFERFYRVSGRRASHGETGSGIGLTIARDIVRAHGGELVARSPGRGRGAGFIGWLPAASLDTRGRPKEEPRR